MSEEASLILKALRKHPKAHIHYFAENMWSMYPNRKVFEEYWMGGDGDKDLSEIEIMEGNDFDSTYCSPLVEALMHLQGKTTSSI